MRLLVVLACAGCGRLAFETHELAGDASSDSPVDGSPFSCVTAVFEEPGIPAGWVTYGGGTVSAEGGRLHMTAPGTDGVDAGVTAAAAMSYAGRVTTIEVPGPSLVDSVQTSIGWHQVTSGRLSVHLEMDGVNLKLSTYDELSTVYEELDKVAYDAIAHRWWRLREVGGEVIAEVSPEGMVWTILGSLPGYDTTDVRLDLGLGAYSGAVQPTEATFDNFVDCTPP